MERFVFLKKDPNRNGGFVMENTTYIEFGKVRAIAHRLGWILTAMGWTGWLTGCQGGFTAVQRPKGQIELRRPEGLLGAVRLTPSVHTLSKEGVDVTVRYASPEELKAFFLDKKIFGRLAGENPYPQETMVFYVKIANHSGKKILVDPEHFVLIDDLNIQYAELSPDDISSLYEARTDLWSFAKTTGDLAPGPYGAPLKVAGALGKSGGRKRHYLIKQVRLAAGYVYPGIAYDGYVAFPRPHPNASNVRLLIYNIKSDFLPSDIPTHVIDFEFSFSIEKASS